MTLWTLTGMLGFREKDDPIDFKVSWNTFRAWYKIFWIQYQGKEGPQSGNPTFREVTESSL